jgi:hypothetical protein
MAEQRPAPVGYDDTPQIPGQRWKVHDIARPQPRVVDPGTASTPERPGRPPSDAVVLFDGSDLSGWVSVKQEGQPAPWKVENGYVEVVPRSGDIRSREEFGDC